MDQAPPGRDRRPLLIGIAIAIVIAVVAVIDFRNLLGEIPGVPPRALVIDVPTKAIFYPGLALAGLAAAGTLLTRSGPGRDPPIEVVAAARFEGRAIQAFGFVLTAIAVLIAVAAVAAGAAARTTSPRGWRPWSRSAGSWRRRGGDGPALSAAAPLDLRSGSARRRAVRGLDCGAFDCLPELSYPAAARTPSPVARSHGRDARSAASTARVAGARLRA